MGSKRSLSLEESSCLITAVLQHPVLWDSTKDTYKDAMAKKTAWQEISHDLNLPLDCVQTRWKSLRDTYSKERKKAVGKSGQAAVTGKKKWTYFDSMTFLDKCLESLPTESNWNNSCQPMFEGMNLIVYSDDSSQNSEIIGANESITNDESSQASLSSQSSVASGVPGTLSSLTPILSPSASPVQTPSSTQSPVPPPLMSPQSLTANASEDFRLPFTKKRKRLNKPEVVNASATEDHILSFIMQRQEDKSRGVGATKELSPEEHFYLSVAARAAKLNFRNRLKLESIMSETLARMYDEENIS